MFVLFNIVIFNNVNMYLLLKLKLAFYCTLLYEITNLLHFIIIFSFVMCLCQLSIKRKQIKKERKKERRKTYERVFFHKLDGWHLTTSLQIKFFKYHFQGF